MAVDAVHRLELWQYQGMVESGILEDDHVEFIEGVIVDMSPHSREHDNTIEVLNDLFTRSLERRIYVVRVQSAMTIGSSEPEPDFAVIERAVPRPYHPGTAALVVEVSVSSRDRDLVRKPRVYAGAAIPEYWVVDLDERRVVVHRDPGADGYRSVEAVTAGELTALGVSVAVERLFAPIP